MSSEYLEYLKTEILGLAECESALQNAAALIRQLFSEQKELCELLDKLKESDEEREEEIERDEQFRKSAFLFNRICFLDAAAGVMIDHKDEVLSKDEAAFGTAVSCLRAALDGYMLLFYASTEYLSDRNRVKTINTKVLEIRRSRNRRLAELFDEIYDVVTIGG